MIFLLLRIMKQGKAPPQLSKFGFSTVGGLPHVTETPSILSCPWGMTWASAPTSLTYSSRLGPEVVEPSLPDHWASGHSASEVAGQAAQNAIATTPQNIAFRIARPSLMPAV